MFDGNKPVPNPDVQGRQALYSRRQQISADDIRVKQEFGSLLGAVRDAPERIDLVSFRSLRLYDRQFWEGSL